jgi:predicted DNA binding CopG/RHH family protein
MKKKYTAKKEQAEIDKKNPPVLTEDDFNPKNAKARINTMIDLDVLDEIRRQAEERGIRYQTLLNMTLRDIFINKKNDCEDTKKLSKEIEIIKKKLEELDSPSFFIKNKKVIKKVVG